MEVFFDIIGRVQRNDVEAHDRQWQEDAARRAVMRAASSTKSGVEQLTISELLKKMNGDQPPQEGVLMMPTEAKAHEQLPQPKPADAFPAPPTGPAAKPGA